MTRVVVVGAGLLGSSVAYHAAIAGGDVVVVERATPGAGTSGASFAWVNAQDKTPAGYFALNADGVAEHRALAERIGGDWYHSGGDLVIGRGAQAEKLREKVERHRALAYPVRLLDRAQLATLEPAIDPGADDVVAHFPDEAWIDAPALVERLLDAAEAAGARRSVGAAVEGFERDSTGAVTGVRLANGASEEGDVVVIAAGPATGALATLVGLSLPMAPSPGLLAVTTPVSAGIGRVVHAGDVALRPERGGRILLSSRSVDAALDPATRSVDPADPACAELLGRAAHVVPSLRDARIEEARIGVRSVPVDGFPAVGFVPAAPGCYVVVSHSGATLTPILGRLVAVEVLGTPQPRLDPWRPARFVAEGVTT